MEKKAFYFSRGAFFGGTLLTTIYTLLNDNDHVVLEMRPANLFRKMKRYEFIMPITEMERLARIIASIRDWKPQYKNERRILDGYGWSLEYHFGDLDFQSHGYMCFPENYKEKVSELQTIIEEFCLKYAPDGYDMGDREERINL